MDEKLSKAESLLYRFLLWDSTGDDEPYDGLYEEVFMFLGLPDRAPELKAQYLADLGIPHSAHPTQEQK